MGKYSGILLCSDFDGTLSYEGKISDENKRAIKAFTDEGGLFTVASGRYYSYLLPFLEGLDINAPLITLNGAVLYDMDKASVVAESFTKGLTQEYISKIFDEVEGIERIIFYMKDEMPSFTPAEKSRVGELDLSGVYKIMVRVENDKEVSRRAINKIKSFTPDTFEVARSWYWGIEVQSIECTKAPATRELARIVGANTLVCVGDFENDIGMIREADIGYAVENSADALLAVADRITVSVEDHAIAKIIEDLAR